MAIDSNIPLRGQPVDTASGVYAAQDQQNQNALATQQVLSQHYSTLDAREKSRLTSTIAGAAQLKTFLDNEDVQGAENFLASRKQALVGRLGGGENIDTQETDAALQMLRGGNLDELRSNIDGLMAAGQVYGIIDSGNDAGGNTGILLNRMVEEQRARGNQGYGLNEALQDLKGGAGQLGRNAADIQSGTQASYATQSGTNISDLEYRPQINAASATAQDEQKEQRADRIALPILTDMLQQNEQTFDAPYLDALQGPAKLAGFESQTTAFDLLKQNRLNLAAPLAKALGVNPTDKDFQATLDRITDTSATKASRRAQLEQVIRQIQTRQSGTQGAGQRVRISNPQTGETLEIDAADLQAAQAEGFVQQ